MVEQLTKQATQPMLALITGYNMLHSKVHQMSHNAIEIFTKTPKIILISQQQNSSRDTSLHLSKPKLHKGNNKTTRTKESKSSVNLHA